ncbi:MAG TPA: ribose 5-phosphate isomerase B [Chitinophagaceae bacterium]|jgi:ribose 5-phosphate isomerase B
MQTTFDLTRPVAIGCDHAGFEYKEAIKKWLIDEGLQVKDFGAYSHDSVDYPDFAHPVSQFVEKGNAAFGILLCGSANGVAITANKHQNIRAALCWQNEVAELVRQHNNANIICLPARFIELSLALEMVETFINTAFEGGRHERRVNKMVQLL